MNIAVSPVILFEKNSLVFASKESIRLKIEGVGVTPDQHYRIEVFNGEKVIYSINTFALKYVELQNVYTPEFDWTPTFSSTSIVNEAKTEDVGVIKLKVKATLLSNEVVSVTNADRFVVYARFNASIYGAEFYDFIKSKKKFLTWKTVRYVTKESPEYLFIFSDKAFPAYEVKVKCYYTDGAVGVASKQSVHGGSTAYSIAVGYNQLSLGAQDKDVDYYEVFLESNGSVISEVITFFVDTEAYLNRRYVVFRNSIGGWDTVLFSGTFEYTNSITSTNAIANKRGELFLKKEDVNVSRVVSTKSGKYPYSDIAYLSSELCGSDRTFLIENSDVTEMIIQDGDYVISDDKAKILDLNLTLKPAQIGFNLVAASFSNPTKTETEEEITSHNHDSLYYRKSVIDSKLNDFVLSATVKSLSADLLLAIESIKHKSEIGHEHTSKEVKFSDGETFEEKLQKGVLKGEKGENSFVTVPDLKAETADKYDEARVAFYPAGKMYYGVNYKWFSVRIVDGAKKFLPIGITYISTDDNGINIFDPITERYIQLKTWEQLRGKNGDSVSILENGNWALNGIDTGVKAEGRKGDPGAEGVSAYKVALNNGFDGTEQQWLDSLRGRSGTNGLGYLAMSGSGQVVPAVGDTVRISISYSSAYQHGTRIRAASMKAPAAAFFEGVIIDSDGTNQTILVDVAEGVGTMVGMWAISVAGVPGRNGIGTNGKSAYEIEKANGTFPGTEADYANSFKELREHPRSKEVHISKEEREFWNSIAAPLIINELPLNVLLNANKRYINVLGFSALTSNNSGGTDMSQGAEIHYQLIAEVNFRLVAAGRPDKVANFNISVTGSTYAGAGVQSCVISKNFDEIGILFSTTASQQIRPDEKYLPRSEYNVLSAYIDKNAMALEPNSYLEVVIRRVYRESSLRDGSKKSFSDSFLEYDYANRKYGYEAMSTNLDIAFCNVVDPLGGKVNDMRVTNPIFNALAAADKDTLIKIIQWLIDSKVDNKLKPNSVLVGNSNGVAVEEEMIDYVDPNLANPTQIHPVGFAVRLNTGFEIAYLHNIFRSIPIAIQTAGVTQIYAPNPARKILVKDVYLLVVSRNSGSVPPSNIRLDLSVNSDGSAPFSTVDFPPNSAANGVVSMSIPATTIDLDRGLFFKTAGFTGYSLQSTVVVIINALYL